MVIIQQQCGIPISQSNGEKLMIHMFEILMKNKPNQNMLIYYFIRYTFMVRGPNTPHDPTLNPNRVNGLLILAEGRASNSCHNK